jgi:hypothetical protein
MQTISSIAQLKNAINLLEVEQSIKGEQLKEQFYLTYESLKPVNLLKSTVKDIASSSNLINSILGTFIGLASGSLSKKVVTGTSDNIFRRLIGSVLQIGVTNYIVQNPETIKSFGQFILDQIRNIKEKNLKKD